MKAYLLQHIMRLARGTAKLPLDSQQRHAQFVKRLQQSDGGYGGRQGTSDPYYTSFALRTLVLTNQLDETILPGIITFLRTRAAQTDSIVDRISTVISIGLIEAAGGASAILPRSWYDELARQLESLRCDDGGYCKGAAGAAGSLYQTFLTLVCYQLMQHPIPKPETIADFVRRRESSQGGFLDIRVAKRPGTNPTAAAIGALKMLDALDEKIVARTCRFLAGMQNEEGGFLANPRIPVADLLSTFTALATLDDLDGLEQVDQVAAHRYVAQRAQTNGGFVAGAWDTTCDIEYTFYGLGCMSLLAATRPG